jgi:hypothetical protein
MTPALGDRLGHVSVINFSVFIHCHANGDGHGQMSEATLPIVRRTLMGVEARPLQAARFHKSA